MGNLVITSHKGGVKFEGNGVEIVFNGFSTKRYSGQNKLDIIGNTKDNYSVFEIKFDDYTAITVNGTAATSADNLQDLLDEISAIGVVDVALQDQHTPSVIAKFNKVSNSTTTTTDVAIDDTSVTLTSVTGVAAGSYLIFFNPTSVRFMTATVLSIAGSPTFTLDTPFDFAFPAGTFVDVATTNMNVNGSVTPQIFGLRGIGSPPGIALTVDITRIIFSCICTDVVDLSKFANFAKLTKGIVCRVRNGQYENVFNVKSNREIAGIMYDWTPFATTNPVQGVDGFVSRLTFAGQSKVGVTKRLELGEDLEIIIQDDLATAQGGETITELEIIAEGHIVE